MSGGGVGGVGGRAFQTWTNGDGGDGGGDASDLDGDDDDERRAARAYQQRSRPNAEARSFALKTSGRLRPHPIANEADQENLLCVR